MYRLRIKRPLACLALLVTCLAVQVHGARSGARSGSGGAYAAVAARSLAGAANPFRTLLEAAAGDANPGETQNRTQMAAKQQRPRRQEPWSALDAYTHVTVDGERLSDALHDALNYNFSIGRPAVKRSLSYVGPNARLRAKLDKLVRGGRSKGSSSSGGGGGSSASQSEEDEEPFRVGVLGGSISFGNGASQSGETDWFSLVGQYLRRAFPGRRFETHNGCVPATPAAFMTLCLERFLDPKVDLVFIEYVLNDGIEDRVAHNRRVRVYERLVRRVLAQPSAPAVVLVQVAAHGVLHARDAVSAAGTLEWRPFHHTQEDLYGAVAAYYSVPTVSFRNAIYRLGLENGRNFAPWMHGDFLHPNDAGHRAMADLAVHLLQQTLVGLALAPLSADEAADARAPLPEPMYPGNYPARRRTCFHADDLRHTVTRAEGWEWVNEGDARSPKWGYVSRAPGAALTVTLDASLASNEPGAVERAPPLAAEAGGPPRGAPPRRHTAVIVFAYLKSYENMGRAVFRCESGCTCKPRYANGATDLPESTIYFVQLHATPSHNCSVAVVNDSGDGAGGATKFKVTGVMVGMADESNLDMSDVDFAEDWPQYGVAGAAMRPSAPGVVGGGDLPPSAAHSDASTAGREARGLRPHRLKVRGRLGGRV